MILFVLYICISLKEVKLRREMRNLLTLVAICLAVLVSCSKQNKINYDTEKIVIKNSYVDVDIKYPQFISSNPQLVEEMNNTIHDLLLIYHRSEELRVR